ncbi:MAG TPA: type II toxin-antitoxin system VapC family toxin [Casimicrobiaceae bacterium]|nr:type II toxin-antitoxin system VapC family toxin [Casimicrobiaceae bacterium]
MIFVDSNVPMYLVGAAHPHKADAIQLLESAIAAAEPLVTSAEVLQEILHRYVAIRRRDAIQAAFDALRNVVDGILPIEASDVEHARALVAGLADLSARDALHAAVMDRHGIERIMTFDRGFDSVPGIRRYLA